MFETFAALSTISMIVIFIVLYRIESCRPARGGGEGRGSGRPAAVARRCRLPTREPRIPLDDVLRFMRLIWAIDHELERCRSGWKRASGLTIPQRMALLFIGAHPRHPGQRAGRASCTFIAAPCRVSCAVSRRRATSRATSIPRTAAAPASRSPRRARREPAARRHVRGRRATAC